MTTIIDLNQERRINQTIKDLQNHLESNSEILDRTINYLSRENAKEKQMVESDKSNNAVVHCRLSSQILRRLEWAGRVFDEDPELSILRVTRSSTMRELIIIGLETLERRHEEEEVESLPNDGGWE